jgi:hypothetical protein
MFVNSILQGLPILLFVAYFGQAQPHTYRSDNSDWWSMLRAPETKESEDATPPQSREPAAANFQILGIHLGENMLSKAKAKLGIANEMERGDASTGRSQICYVSPDTGEKVYLIFEQGEVAFSFYLFAGGADWGGSNQCASTKFVSSSLATASGLHLGQTPAEVRSILGKPSTDRKNELFYSFMVEKKNSAKDIEEEKKNNPSMSEKEIHENYDTYSLGVSIDAKFQDNKLVYLAVLKSETN